MNKVARCQWRLATLCFGRIKAIHSDVAAGPIDANFILIRIRIVLMMSVLAKKTGHRLNIYIKIVGEREKVIEWQRCTLRLRLLYFWPPSWDPAQEAFVDL